MRHTIVMTGATRGIGRVAAARILTGSPGAHLVVLARDGGGAELARELGRHDRPVTSIDADLLSMGSVRAAADELAGRLDSGDLPPLRALAGNAGLQYTNNLTRSPDGLEATFAINVLAHHVLIRRLQDHLDRPSRVVITVSDTHFGDLRHNLGMVPAPQWHLPDVLARTGAFANPGTVTAGRTAYSTSKLAAIHLIHEYARRLPPGVDVIGYNPGLVPGTALTRDAGALSRFAMRRVMPLLALTPLATSPGTAGRRLADVVLGRIPTPTGGYVDRDRIAPSSMESYDPEREAELWDALERLNEHSDH